MRQLLTTTLAIATLTLSACDRGSTPPAPDAEQLASAKPYPLTTCIVSDEPLGSMGEPIVRVHEGQQVKFCCAGCVESFNAEPATFLAKLTASQP